MTRSVEEISFSEYAGSFLAQAGEDLKGPFYTSSEGVTQAIAQRSFALLAHTFASLATIPLYILGGIIQGMGEMLLGFPYFYIRGTAPESWNPNDFTLLTFNDCMYWGELPTPFGGVDPAWRRLDALEQLLRTENADIVALQEMSFGAGLALGERLKDLYPHIYTNIGGIKGKTIFYSAGTELFIASKAPILSAQFIPFPNKFSEKLGFFCIETPSNYIITAHFPDGKKEMWAGRRELIELVDATIQQLKATSGKPCFFMGDLNIRRTNAQNDEYALSGIPQRFYDPALAKYPDFNEQTATCTNALVALKMGRPVPEHDPYEIDDYILLDIASKDLFNIDIELGDTYDLNNYQTALSDHRYYKARVRANALSI